MQALKWRIHLTRSTHIFLKHKTVTAFISPLRLIGNGPLQKTKTLNGAALDRLKSGQKTVFTAYFSIRLLMEPNPTPSTMTSELMEKRRAGRSTRNLPKAMSALIFHILFCGPLGLKEVYKHRLFNHHYELLSA